MKNLARLAAVFAVMAVLVACTSDQKPTDPAAFTQAWLNHVMKPDSAKDCELAVAWTASDVSDIYGHDCARLKNSVLEASGIQPDSKISDCRAQLPFRDDGSGIVECSAERPVQVTIGLENGELESWGLVDTRNR